MPTLSTFGAASARGFGETVGGRLVANITISSDTANYTLGTSKVTGYKAGKTDVILTINSGVYVYSSSTGSYAFTVDNTWTTGDTVTIVNNGTIIGRGGTGGNSRINESSLAGSSGGPALYVQRAASINNVNRISGGGGGGGGGQSVSSVPSYPTGGSGGGGIGGSAASPNPPNAGFGAGSAGSAGTLSAAGSGGSGQSYTGNYPKGGSYTVTAGNGGAGGSYGSSGSTGSGVAQGNPAGSAGSGGAAGAAVVGNSNITWIATGTRNGSISQG